MKSTTSRISMAIALATCLLAVQGPAVAQTDIEFTTDLWAPNLPNYHAGSVVTQGVGTVLQTDIFENDQFDIGREVGIQGFHQLGDSCWKLEFDANFAWSNPSVASLTFSDPGPTQSIWFAALDGNAFIATADGQTATYALDSDVIHFREYVGLRRNRFCGPIGIVDVGVGFSHMAFEQDFALNATFDNGSVGQYLENLDTDFFGGEIRSTWHRDMFGRPVFLDINVGLFDMRADYAGVSNIFNNAGVNIDQANGTGRLNELATTVDVGLRTESTIFGVQVRSGIGFKYISHMPLINHPQTIIGATPVSFDTDQSFTFHSGIEILL